MQSTVNELKFFGLREVIPAAADAKLTAEVSRLFEKRKYDEQLAPVALFEREKRVLINLYNKVLVLCFGRPRFQRWCCAGNAGRQRETPSFPFSGLRPRDLILS